MPERTLEAESPQSSNEAAVGRLRGPAPWPGASGWAFLAQFLGSQPAQFIVDERKQLIACVLVAARNRIQDPGDLEAELVRQAKAFSVLARIWNALYHGPDATRRTAAGHGQPGAVRDARRGFDVVTLLVRPAMSKVSDAYRASLGNLGCWRWPWNATDAITATGPTASMPSCRNTSPRYRRLAGRQTAPFQARAGRGRHLLDRTGCG
jgi:hypothetical protein